MQGSSDSEQSATDEYPDSRRSSRRSNWWYLLLLIPLVGLLYPPFYDQMYPTLGGVPFFVWYQFAWVFGGVATTVIVSWLTD